MYSSLQYSHSILRFGALAECGLDEILTKDFSSSRKVVITDENVFDIWGEHLITHFEGLSEADIIHVPPGEENKTIEICTQVWGVLSEYQIDRNDLIINIGGGMVTDLGGFIASTFKRGLKFINIPTSLLAQVDASVGGKTGIDIGPYKNQVGVFSNPEMVFIDEHFLSTLPEEEIRSGFAEMLKHGLIGDVAYWRNLQTIDLSKTASLGEFIYRSVEMKKIIVEADFKENGIRKALNFGHTIGHALEGFLMQTGKPQPHGVCVAWGMVAEAYLSSLKSLITPAELDEIKNSIHQYYAPLIFPEGSIVDLLKIMQNDKKNAFGTIGFTLLNGIGSVLIDQTASEEEIESALRFILRFSK